MYFSMPVTIFVDFNYYYVLGTGTYSLLKNSSDLTPLLSTTITSSPRNSLLCSIGWADDRGTCLKGFDT